jgi:hypothetical protein
MESDRIQNMIIRKVLDTEDEILLEYLNNLLSAGEADKMYVLTADEKAIITESLSDYESGRIISNDEVNARNRGWLKE